MSLVVTNMLWGFQAVRELTSKLLPFGSCSSYAIEQRCHDAALGILTWFNLPMERMGRGNSREERGDRELGEGERGDVIFSAKSHNSPFFSMWYAF